MKQRYLAGPDRKSRYRQGYFSPRNPAKYNERSDDMKSCVICNKNYSGVGQTCSTSCRSSLSWRSNQAPRKLGKKNKNPYPKTEAVLAGYRAMAEKRRGITRSDECKRKIAIGQKSRWDKMKETDAYEKVRENMSKAVTKAYMNGRSVTAGHKHTMKGKFKPLHPEKYKGDPSQIIYRSSWEFKMMSRLDKNPDIIQWSSEEVRVPYKSKVDGQRHTYFPDFWIKTKKKTVLVEIKPRKQTEVPVQPKRLTKKYVNEVLTYAKNISKWEAATEYAKSRGWEFQILTEHELGIK